MSSTDPRVQTQSRPTTPAGTTPSTRRRSPRRSRVEGLAAETPRYIILGEGSRFEFALATIAMVVIWVSFVAVIFAL
jgi:hypothetical protein